MEYAAIELNTNNSGKLLIAVFYRPPSVPTEWLHGFIRMLNNCNYDRVLFIGDFNLPDITWIEGFGFCPSSESAVFTFCEEPVSHNLFQLIDSPTRGNNCLDLLITSIVEGVSNIDIAGCDSVALSSDHCALTFLPLHSLHAYQLITTKGFDLTSKERTLMV